MWCRGWAARIACRFEGFYIFPGHNIIGCVQVRAVRGGEHNYHWMRVGSWYFAITMTTPL